MNEFDELWPDGPKFAHADGSFKLSTDSVLLSHFVNMTRVRRCMDLGSGAGVLTVLLAAKNPSARVEGVELQPEAAELSRLNLAANAMLERANIVTGDLREHRGLFEAGAYDLVVSNPPYFPQNSGYAAPDLRRAAAREERSCSLYDVCAAAAYLCRWGGSFALVHRPERLSEIFCTMASSGIEPKRLRLVSYRASSAPSLVLVEGRRGAKPGLVIEAPLILTDESGRDTGEVRAIYYSGT